jgi:hypothetical protein
MGQFLVRLRGRRKQRRLRKLREQRRLRERRKVTIK